MTFIFKKHLHILIFKYFTLILLLNLVFLTLIQKRDQHGNTLEKRQHVGPRGSASGQGAQPGPGLASVTPHGPRVGGNRGYSSVCTPIG